LLFFLTPITFKNSDGILFHPEIRLYEPREALLAGEEGLDIIERILKEGEPFLKEGGLFFLEHDPEEREAIQKLADTLSLEYLRSIPDLTGNERASVIRKRRSNNEKTHR
jgi:release factor glutamine methyltransferase